jgi:hypothetical protein
VDGGPDAICSLVLCVAELLVAKGLCKRVVITRLPVGHTHEDIDSLFAKIWKKLRRMHVITPQQYEKLAKSALYKDGRPVDVKDVFCVPDFQSFIANDCGDSEFGRWKMTKWAQLQFTVEWVGECGEFPLGVKTTYRSHCKDKVILFEEDPDPEAIVPMEPVELHVHTLPKPSAERPSGGMYILRRLPTAPIKPGPFIQGSRDILDKALGAIAKEYTNTNPQWITAWKEWANTAPESDSVQDYITTHPEKWHIPFKELLFKDQDFNDQEVSCVQRNSRVIAAHSKPKFRQMEVAECVQWRGNGGKKYKVEPMKPLGQSDVIQNATILKKRSRSKPSFVKQKKQPSGRSSQVEKVDCGDYSGESDEEVVVIKPRPRQRRIIESDDESEGIVDSKKDSICSDEEDLSDEDGSDIESGDEVGNSDREVSDDELDDLVYENPDELGFLALKPGPRTKIGSKYRDNTYIRIYGCASHYLKWQFRHVCVK